MFESGLRGCGCNRIAAFEATRLEYICRVVAVSMHEEVKELRKAHESWESFEEALLEVYEYAKP